MTKKTKTEEVKETVIAINGVDYNASDLSEAQIHCINQITDLDIKVKTANLNLEQLMMSRNAFMQILTESTESSDSEESESED